jgi:hypothetical protein
MDSAQAALDLVETSIAAKKADLLNNGTPFNHVGQFKQSIERRIDHLAFDDAQLEFLRRVGALCRVTCHLDIKLAQRGVPRTGQREFGV